MKRNFILVFLLLSIAIFSIDAKVVKNVRYSCNPQGVIRIDSIDYRANLTRVYCKVYGKPHTSMKFDAISGCTDIDGVDLKRWFQFEESGRIALEIDFKANPQQKFNFIITTPKENITINILK